MTLWIDSLIKLAAAAFLGGLVGLEREFSHKPAGLRTNMLISTGAALMMIVSQLVATVGGRVGDPGRIAAQVVTGIGFLGAGVIIQSRGSVLGVTTGAAIFTNAAIGLAVGGGFYIPAVVGTLIVLVSLLVVGKFEKRIEKRIRSKNHNLSIRAVAAETAPDVVIAISRMIEQQGLHWEELSVLRSQDGFDVRLSVRASSDLSEKLLAALMAMPGIVRVEFPHEGA